MGGKGLVHYLDSGRGRFELRWMMDDGDIGDGGWGVVGWF